MKHLQLTPGEGTKPLKDSTSVPAALPEAKETKLHPANAPDAQTNASLFFVGTATTIIEWEGLRILTDPNFLHAGDHVHLGPGVSATRQTNPAIDIDELPHIDAILLSHYHEDHFDALVEDKLSRSIPIITTPHAHRCLTSKGAASFTNVHALDFWASLTIDVKPTTATTGATPSLKITGMPGKHIPPGPLNMANELLGAVPPTNGWMVELGYSSPSPPPNADGFASGYRVYITGDTLMVDELREIPTRYAGLDIDLMLVHLGGTTIPGPRVPLLMVTMDAVQGVQLMRLIDPDVTIPVHYDDYDVFLSPLEDFKKEVERAGLGGKVVYLDRREEYRFLVERDGEGGKKGTRDLLPAS